jgi:hypothetical protein
MDEAVCKQNQQVGHRFAVIASWRVGENSFQPYFAAESQAASDELGERDGKVWQQIQ